MGMEKFIAWCPLWLAIPLVDRESRRLLIWSCALAVRVWALELMVSLAWLVATRGVVNFLRRRMEALAADIAELKRAVLARNRPVPPFTNPWT
jgi:hypothetical protein